MNKFAAIGDDRSKHPLYQTWWGMINRCDNPNKSAYGGKGIKVCQEWRDDFWQFVADMGPKPDDGQRYTVERKDGNGDYCPSNCKWATYTEQNRNRKTVSMITVDGVTRSRSEWSELTGLSRPAISGRQKKINLTPRQVVGLDPVPGEHRKRRLSTP